MKRVDGCFWVKMVQFSVIGDHGGVTRVYELLFNFPSCFVCRGAGFTLRDAGFWVFYSIFLCFIRSGSSSFQYDRETGFFFVVVVQINANVTLIIRPVEFIVR